MNTKEMMYIAKGLQLVDAVMLLHAAGKDVKAIVDHIVARSAAGEEYTVEDVAGDLSIAQQTIDDARNT